MASTGETMDQKAKRAAADAKSGASEFADTARERAREMAGEARERAYEYGRDYKDEAANETSKIADALRKASEDLHDGSPQERIFAKLADTVADTADGMREMELDEMAYAVNDFARRNSAAFLGGAALLGFVAARFMKASARHDDYHRSGSFGSGDYGRDDRYAPDVTPNDYDEDDRVSRPVPSSDPVTSAAPRPAPTTTTQPAARPATAPATTGATTGAAGSTGSAGGAASDISRGTSTTGGTGSISSGSSSAGGSDSVGGIDKPDDKPEIPGAPQPGTTGAVKK
jgi:vacuolar-type H+-ATPase subunit H